MELLKSKNDVVFHCLFRRGNEKKTKDIAEALWKLEDISEDKKKKK